MSRTDKKSRLEMKLLINDNRIYTHSLEICELFNKHFSSVSSKTHESIPAPISEDDFSYYVRNIQMSIFFFRDTNK